jgi:phage terminase large subunit GpA-like protein
MVSWTMPLPLPMQPEERDALEPRDRLSVSQWAAEFRQLSPKTTDLHGRWSHEYVPYAVEIMDSLSSPGIRQVTLRKSSQSAGTEMSSNFLGWAVDESPAPMLLVMPREDDVVRRVATRVKPMFEATPSLLRHLGGRMDALNIGKETELDSMILYLAWSTSAAALADNPVCYIVLDEVGKFPSRVNKEADPVSLAKDRQRTFFHRSKLFVLSSPVHEGDLICREYNRGDRRIWWAPCGDCRRWQPLAWSQVQLDKTADGRLLEPQEYLDGEHAHYACRHCGALWDEARRWQAVSAGRWLPDCCQLDAEGRIDGQLPATTHRSYHVHALMLHPHFMTMGRMAAQWAEAQEHLKAGDAGPLQDFINSQLGEAWVETAKAADPQQLASHVGEVPMGLLPEAVQVVTAGVDLQIDHAWLIILGWGFLSECWVIHAQRVETGDTSVLKNWTLLRELLATVLPRAARPEMGLPLSKIAFDCNYRRDEVLDFCRQAAELPIVPVRGDPACRTLIRTAKVGSDIRYDLNTGAYKDRLARLVESRSPGPGYLHLPADLGQLAPELLEHFSAEQRRPIRDRRGVVGHEWVKRANRANHLWDAAVYATAAADLAGARLIRNPATPAALPRQRAGVMERYRR